MLGEVYRVRIISTGIGRKRELERATTVGLNAEPAPKAIRDTRPSLLALEDGPVQSKSGSTRSSSSSSSSSSSEKKKKHKKKSSSKKSKKDKKSKKKAKKDKHRPDKAG